MLRVSLNLPELFVPEIQLMNVNESDGPVGGIASPWPPGKYIHDPACAFGQPKYLAPVRSGLHNPS
ncbi:uncharacterized protein ACLA_037620 [Aspergillus clavatus NRRL 1]|uniref:Uncharacterized protein n=1 Tax=Aspergillus clavatus (strain ATCC 1007 / CBS 513.65 / DSM 816 / NCTC 3887 / NRRL 1 / QM 1276 / 107) TaxID=344612 RepID=A1CK81_ASPCL|nr:uncharacterized protein ACLA_037620 [Aspergillus clavatus NRRL 1]EAW09555.1 hypothetical protein ACLA_037620 [Aspergillus clavatus NRRL 1]